MSEHAVIDKTEYYIVLLIITLGATTSSRWEGNAAGERESKFITASKDEGTAPTWFKELSSHKINYYRKLIICNLHLQIYNFSVLFFSVFLWQVNKI